MIGILISGHRNIPSAFVDLVKAVIGVEEGIDFLSTHGFSSAYDLEKVMAEKIERLDRGDGVLVLTDLFGGTASNVASALRRKSKHNFVVLTGVNVPMVVQAVILRMDVRDLNELADKVLEAAKEGLKKVDSL